MSSIFVNICSHRDKFLSATVKSLFENESGRNHITYGIFEQTKIENSLVIRNPEIINHPRVRYKRIDPEYTDGVMWARGINAMQIRDEEFQYQIDSHMLFDKAWDNYLIVDYNRASTIANSKKVILTSGAKNFDVVDGKIEKYTIKQDITSKLGFYGIDKNLYLFSHNVWKLATSEPEPAIHVSAGNLFMPTQWVRDVGYDSNIFFAGEEQFIYLKSFLADYQVFHQRKMKTYHYVRSSSHLSKPTIEPLIDQEKLNKAYDRTWEYFNRFVYSLSEETLEEFRKLTGVDYINRKIEKRSLVEAPENNKPTIENDWEIAEE